MFSDLKSKVVSERSKRKPGDSQSISANSRTNSNESLVSLTSTTGSTYRKSDRFKHLETKLADLGNLLRQKNASLEAAQKAIDRLTLELKQNQQASRLHADGLNANHIAESNKKDKSVDPVFKEYSDLSEKLLKAEADLAKVNQLSEEVFEQKNQLQLKANQELENVKNNLSRAEEEIRQLQAQLVNKAAEIERLSRQIAQSSRELEVKNEALENTKNARTKLMEDHATQEELIRLLRNDKEAAEASIKELTSTIEQVRGNLRQQERLVVEEADRAGAARAELEKLKARLTSVEVRAADHESAMKDRIRLLEERLVLLTEPDDALFTDHVEEAKLSSSSGAPLPDETVQPGVAAARCITLLVERKLLENRLKDTRAHLEEVKSSWNEKLSTLESQIAHLNGKIMEDSKEHEAARTEWEALRQQLESQVELAREECKEAKSKLSRLESEASERARHTTQLDEDWNIERASLTAQVAALQQAGESDTLKHSEVIQELHKLQSSLSAMEASREVATKEAEVKSKELEIVKVELASWKSNGEKQVNSIAHLEEKLKEMERTCLELTTANADFADQIASLTSDKQTLNSAKKSLQLELSQTSTNLEATNSQLSETQQRLISSDAACQKLEVQNATLLVKIEELERVQATADRDSNEVSQLKEAIEALNETVTERNKTIRLQKQKLAELRRAFGQGLRSNVPASSSSVTLNDDDQSNENYGNGIVSSALDAISSSIAASHQSFPPPAPMSPQANLQRHAPPYPHAPPPPPTVSTYSPQSHRTSVAQLPVEQMGFPATNSQADIDRVNFDYLRHVILKFLLSRESEAMQLVRVIVTILRFSKEDEFLIRQTLESRKSWFNTAVVSPKSSGQFAKVISPPF